MSDNLSPALRVRVQPRLLLRQAIMTRIALLLTGFALLVLPSHFYAQSPQPTNETSLRSAVRKGSDTTYFDLLRMVLPDLQMNPTDSNSATAHRTIPIKHIEAKEADTFEGDLTVTTSGTRSIMSDGRQIVLLQFDLSADGANGGTPYEGQAALLAAFSVDPRPKLLDVMDIKTDRFTDFWEDQPVFRLNSKNEAFVVHNTHFNAGESYNDFRLMFLDGDRFKTITSIFLLNTQGCGATFDETPSFRALPDGQKYPKIVVKVKLQKEADSRECSRRTAGYTKYYEAVFYWNSAKARYQTNSLQLSALDKFNRART